MADIFSKKKDPHPEEHENLIEELYRKIGQQDIDLEFLKKVQAVEEPVKRGFVEKDHEALSVRRQCEVLALNRSSLYYDRRGLSEEDQAILDEIDRIYLDFPYYGSGKMSRELMRRRCAAEVDQRARSKAEFRAVAFDDHVSKRHVVIVFPVDGLRHAVLDDLEKCPRALRWLPSV